MNGHDIAKALYQPAKKKPMGQLIAPQVINKDESATSALIPSSQKTKPKAQARG